MSESNPRKVLDALSRAAGRQLCDRCLARRAGVRNVETVNPIAATLALVPGFRRRRGPCTVCGERRLVTSRRDEGDDADEAIRGDRPGERRSRSRAARRGARPGDR